MKREFPKEFLSDLETHRISWQQINRRINQCDQVCKVWGDADIRNTSRGSTSAVTNVIRIALSLRIKHLRIADRDPAKMLFVTHTKYCKHASEKFKNQTKSCASASLSFQYPKFRWFKGHQSLCWNIWEPLDDLGPVKPSLTSDPFVTQNFHSVPTKRFSTHNPILCCWPNM